MRKKFILYLFSCFVLFVSAEDLYLINDNSVRIRKVPSISGEIIDVLNAGTKVEVIQKGDVSKVDTIEAPWYQVRLVDSSGARGIVGWVFSHYLSAYMSFKNERDLVIRSTNNSLIFLGQKKDDIEKTLRNATVEVVSYDNKFLESDKVKQFQITGNGITLSCNFITKKLTTIVITTKDFQMMNGFRIGMSLEEVHRYIRTSNLNGSNFIWLNGQEAVLTFDVDAKEKVSRIILTSEM